MTLFGRQSLLGAPSRWIAGRGDASVTMVVTKESTAVVRAVQDPVVCIRWATRWAMRVVQSREDVGGFRFQPHGTAYDVDNARGNG
jgi:hypothetical protein